LDGSFIKLAQLLQFRNNEQERVKEAGAGAGDARPNSEKPPAFFFGAAASVSETVPSPFAAAFFAFFGAGENRLQKGLSPFSVFADGLSWTGATFLMLFVAAFFAATLALALALNLFGAAFFGAAFFRAALTRSASTPPSSAPSRTGCRCRSLWPGAPQAAAASSPPWAARACR
jgi:hypothetical protein